MSPQCRGNDGVLTLGSLIPGRFSIANGRAKSKVLTSSLPPGARARSGAMKMKSHYPRPYPYVGEQWLQMTSIKFSTFRILYTENVHFKFIINTSINKLFSVALTNTQSSLFHKMSQIFCILSHQMCYKSSAIGYFKIVHFRFYHPLFDQNSMIFQQDVNLTKIFYKFSTNCQFHRMLHSTKFYIQQNGFQRNVMEAV